MDSLPSDREALRLLMELHVGYSDNSGGFDFELSIEHARHAVTVAKALGDELTCAQANFTLLDRYWGAGHLNAMMAKAKEVVETSSTSARSTLSEDDVNEHMPIARTLDRMANCYILRGQLRQGMKHLERAIRLRRRDQRAPSLQEISFRYDPSSYAGSEHQWLEHLQTAANGLRFVGDWHRLEPCTSAYESLSDEIGVPFLRLHGFILRARLLSMFGEWRQLEAHVQALDENDIICGTRHEKRARRQMQFWQAEADAHLRNTSSPLLVAIPSLLKTDPEDPPAGVRGDIQRIDVYLRLLRAWIWCTGPRGFEYAEEQLRDVDTMVDRTGFKCYAPYALELRAQLAAVCGDAVSCHTYTIRAAELWERIDAQPHIERMSQELSQLSDHWS